MNIDTTYLRPLKARCTRNILEAYRDLGDDPGIEVMHDVTLTPLGVRPDIDDDAPCMLHDDCAYRAAIGTPDSPESVGELSGKVLYGGFLRSQWGHFLMNSTARLWPMFGRKPMEFDKILFFSDKPGVALSGNYLEFMKLAGIADRIVVVDHPVRVGHLTVATPALMHYHSYSSRMYDIFRTVRDAALRTAGTRPSVSPRKIFLTRSQLKGASRYEINLELVDRFFAAGGYEVVAPEKLKLTELIVMMSECSDIAAVSGSLAHNFLLAPHQARFVTIERTAAVNPFQVAVSLIMKKGSVGVDAFRLPMIAPSTGQLFLYGATAELNRFAADRGMSPAEIPDTQGCRRRELRRFVSAYGRLYGRTTGIYEWESASFEAIAEAYRESAAYYGALLQAGSCLLWVDLLSPRKLARFLLRRH